jgi:hypothetical protein
MCAQVRNMNIVDPLSATNNLGRSVSRANKARIRKALERGAATLAGILDKARSLPLLSPQPQPLHRGAASVAAEPACAACHAACNLSES